MRKILRLMTKQGPWEGVGNSETGSRRKVELERTLLLSKWGSQDLPGGATGNQMGWWLFYTFDSVGSKTGKRVKEFSFQKPPCHVMKTWKTSRQFM